MVGVVVGKSPSELRSLSTLIATDHASAVSVSTKLSQSSKEAVQYGAGVYMVLISVPVVSHPMTSTRVSNRLTKKYNSTLTSASRRARTRRAHIYA